MNYKIIKIDFYQEIKEHVVIENGDGSFESFPADPENPHYQQFLEQLEGNEPEVIDG